MPAQLLTERVDNTLVLTFSDPAHRNALSPEVCAAGIETLNVAESDAALRCVVLRGEHAHFCSGFIAGESPPAGHEALLLRDFVDALRTCIRPVVAAVEGSAIDAGFALALGCDHIVAAEDAQFAITSARAHDAVAQSALTCLPRSLALDMLWLGQPLGARQLHGLGLVRSVVHGQHATTEALKLASQLAALEAGEVSRLKEIVTQAMAARRKTLA